MSWRDWLFEKPEKAAPEQRSGPIYSIADPALAEWLGIVNSSIKGVDVSETSALGVTAFWRGVNLIAGTIAGLPLKTYEGEREVPSWLDDPAQPYPLSKFNWVEMIVAHLLIRGEAFLRHEYTQGGVLIGAWPVHPAAVEVKWDGPIKRFKVAMADGSKKDYDTTTMTHVMGLSLDGLRGLSVLSIMRHAISLGIAGDTAAGRTFGNGMTIAGLVTTEEDVEEAEAKAIKASLNAKLTGVENAGDIAFVNRNLKFTPWAMTNEDAQFLESREFSVTDFARILGIPPHLLGVVGAVSNWGTGVAESYLGLQKFTLMGWTSRIEQALTKFTLPPGVKAEFEYKGLLQGTPQVEIEMLIAQVGAKFLTVDEARELLNRPALPKSEVEPPALPEPTPLKKPA